MELTKELWLRNRKANEELILNNTMQIEMAKRVIELCDEKIKEFPEEPTIEALSNA